MPTDNRIGEFFNAINEDLQRQVNEITEEANRLKAEQTKKAKRDAKKQTDSFLRGEMANIMHSSGRRVAAARAGAKKELLERRAALEQQAFDQAAQKLKAFTETPEYESFLTASAHRMAAHFNGGEIVFYLRREDEKYTEAIAATVPQPCRFETDDGIRIGGCRAVSESSRLAADDTLDARLESQRDWFGEHSGLSAHVAAE